MKTNIQRLTYITTVLSFLVSISVTYLPAKAEASMYLEPTNSTTTSGQNVTVNVRVNSSDPFNTAQIDLSYSSSTLQLVSTSLGSALPNKANENNTAGNISYALYNLNSVSGDNLLLLQMIFKTTAGTGTVSFKPTSRILEAGETVATGSGSSTITIKAPTSTPTTTPPPATTNTPKPSSPVPSVVDNNESQPLPKRTSSPPPQTETNPQVQATAKKTDKTPPKIISIAPSGFVDDNISIKITTDEPTKASVKAGVKKSSLLIENLSSGSYKKIYFVSLGKLSKSLEQGKKLYYQATVSDIAGNSTESKLLEISTNGVDITLTIINSDDTPLKNKNIIINGKEFKTNGSGVVNIANVVPGIVNTTVQSDDGEKINLADITVVEGVSDQNFELQIPSVDGLVVSNGSPITLQNSTPYLIGIVGALILFVIFKLILRKQREHKEMLFHTANPYGSIHNLGIKKANKSNPASQVIAPGGVIISDQKNSSDTKTPNDNKSNDEKIEQNNEPKDLEQRPITPPTSPAVEQKNNSKSEPAKDIIKNNILPSDQKSQSLDKSNTQTKTEEPPIPTKDQENQNKINSNQQNQVNKNDDKIEENKGPHKEKPNEIKVIVGDAIEDD